jgi:hypothetical protein
MVKIGLIISCSARGTPSIMITIPFSGDVMRTRLALHEDGGSPPLFRESVWRGGVGPHPPQQLPSPFQGRHARPP